VIGLLPLLHIHSISYCITTSLPCPALGLRTWRHGVCLSVLQTKPTKKL